MSDPVFLSIDCLTHRIRRYEGKVLIWNHRFDRLPDFQEVQEFREIETVFIPVEPEAA